MKHSRRRIAWVAACSLLSAASPVATPAAEWGPISISREVIQPGARKKFTYIGERSFEGSFVDFTIFVARGVKPGPTLCVTSGIHGDEINSVEIARRVFASVDAVELSGTLIVLPAINSLGFRMMNRYMPDRRDLNRSFPGNPDGSVATIVADAAFSGVIRNCTHLVDLHTGSNFRTNLPQIRVDTSDPVALEMAYRFGVGVIVAGAGPSGSLRREAMKIGIPSIIYEAGPPFVFVEAEIERGASGVQNLMNFLAMVSTKAPAERAQMLGKSAWLRAPRGQGGIYLPVVKLGDVVTPGQLLATVTDPVTDVSHEIRASNAGVVVGMALPQVVLSGYGLFHIGELND